MCSSILNYQDNSTFSYFRSNYLGFEVVLKLFEGQVASLKQKFATNIVICNTARGEQGRSLDTWENYIRNEMFILHSLFVFSMIDVH